MPRITGLIPRSTWGARFAAGFGKRPIPFSEWWLHHSVTLAPDLVPPWTDDDAAVRRLEDIGQSRFGGGISYTVPITPAGRAYEGHAIDQRGAHTGGHNTVAGAICFVGNYDTHKPTPLQIEKAAQVLVRSHRQGLSTRHTFNGGHRDTGFATACPGRHAMAAIPVINARANALWASGYGKTALVASAIPVIVKTVTRAPLVVDGDLGPATIRQWQKVMGTYVDGVISHPRSSLVMAVQKRLGVKADGDLGPITWRAIQRRLGVKADGVPGPITTKALQRRLNTGKF